jgi:hypothetical protein
LLLSVSEPTVDRRSGLLNVVDVVIAPGSAFARLRLVPTWGWSFLVAALLAVAGSLLMQPAMLHVMDKTLPAQMARQDAAAIPKWNQMSADDQAKTVAQQVGLGKAFAQYGWIALPFALLIGGLVQALVMLIANAVGHGDGTFRKYFALSLTVSVVGYGLATLVLGLIVVLRGQSGFESMSALQAAVPSLALLAPGAQGALAGFLSAINVFALWGTALLALGMTVVGRVARGPAWAAALLLLLLSASFVAFGAARQG